MKKKYDSLNKKSKMKECLMIIRYDHKVLMIQNIESYVSQNQGMIYDTHNQGIYDLEYKTYDAKI